MPVRVLCGQDVMRMLERAKELKEEKQRAKEDSARKESESTDKAHRAEVEESSDLDKEEL